MNGIYFVLNFIESAKGAINVLLHDKGKLHMRESGTEVQVLSEKSAKKDTMESR